MKDIFQTILLFISILISSCFLSTIVSSTFSLQGENNFMSSKNVDDFQFNYISTAYEENDISTISPFFSFSNAVIENGAENYATINVGSENSSLLNLNKDALSKYINWNEKQLAFSIFNFDDFTNNDLELVRTGKIGGFFNFNFDGSEFKNSMIGKLYEKFSLNDESYSATQKEIAGDILQYFRDLYRSNVFANVESFILEFLEDNGINSSSSKDDVVNKICEAINFKDSVVSKTKEQLLKNGFNGKVGQLISGERFYNKDSKYAVDYKSMNGSVFYIGDEIEFHENHSNAWNQTNVRPEPDSTIQTKTVNDYQSVYNSINRGVFEIRKTVYSDFFAISPKNNDNLKNRDFLNCYISLIGKLSNFNLEFREQAVAWNNNINGDTNKFKIIDIEDLKRNNEVRVFEKDSNIWNDNKFLDGSIMITPVFAKANNLKLGDILTLGNNKEFQIGAIGGDTQNIYPLIYDTDIIPNQSNEAVIYVNSRNFNQLFSSSLTTTVSSSFDASQFQDTSVITLQHFGNAEDINSDINLFKTFYADNTSKLNKVSKALTEQKTVTNANVAKFKNIENDLTQNLRKNLLFKATFIWTLANLVIGLIFIVLSVYVLTKSIQKIISRNKHTLGILKASGFSTLKISGTYPLIVSIFAPVIVLIGSLLSFGLIKLTSNIFTSYFVIREFVLFDWKSICIIFFVISIILFLVAFISAYLTLKVNPLELINDVEIEKNSLLTKWVDNFKIKQFNNRLGLKIGVRALPSIRLFTFMTFISMMAVSVTSTVPFALDNGDEKYYQNERWNVETKYQQSVTNNPFAMLGEYDYEGYSDETSLDYPIASVALIPRYVKINNALYDTYKNKLVNGGEDDSTSFDKALMKNNDTIYNYMEHSIIDNFLQLKSLNLSLGILKTFVDAYPNENTLRQQIVYLVSSIIPKVFGQKEIDYPYLNDAEGYFKNLKYCLEKITNSILPALVKETWFKNENNANTFVLGVGSIPVNNKSEEVFTWAKGSNGDDIYGISENSQFIDGIDELNRSDDFIPVLANTKYLMSNNKHVGNELTENIDINELKFNIGTTDEPKYISIDKDDWLYNDQKIVDQKDINLTNLVSTLQNYDYTDANGNDYTNLENISLLINKNDVADYKEHSIFFDSSKPWCVDEGDKWKIKVFDYSFDENNDITDITGLKNAPLNWITKARNQKFITFVKREKQLHLKIVGEQKTYDQPKLFTSKLILNNALETYFGDRYFNGKLSTEKNNFEETKKYILFDETGMYSIADFTKLKSAINSTDYVYLKKQILNQLSHSLTLILIVPTVFIIVFAVIIITLAINWLLQQFKKVIALFKVIGYKNSEILSILLKIFVPPILIGWVLGNLTVHLILITIANSVLKAVNIPITIDFNAIIMVIPLILITILFTSIFAISYNRTRKMHIQEILEI
jgi:putative ABC transport system permease protein